MTPYRAYELKPRMEEADGTLGDNDETNREAGTEGTPTVQAVVTEDHWYYYHVSTP